MLENATSYDRNDSNLDGTANIKNIIESIPSLSTLSSYFNVYVTSPSMNLSFLNLQIITMMCVRQAHIFKSKIIVNEH
jgi:hypothetical protein